jgi:hypothetical protein
VNHPSSSLILVLLAAANLAAVLGGCSDDGGTPAQTPDSGGTDIDALDAVADASDSLEGDTPEGDASDGSGEGDGSADVDTGPPARPYPEPGAFPPNEGPGVPAVTFTEEELFQNCAYLDGGEDDFSDHHNLLVMYEGYLLMPWAPEYGRGGLTFFDITDPCDPQRVSGGYSETMRETHSIGFMETGGQRYAVVNNLLGVLEGGIEFWDLTDLQDPHQVSFLHMPGFIYPDAYARLVLSVFWQAPYVFVAGADNGFYVVDASDPLNPEFVTQYTFDPVLRVGQVQVIGNLLIATAAEGARTALIDVSDATNPVPIPGGDFVALDENGEAKEAYFTNSSGGYVFYARKQGGGGPMIMDIHDPSNPTFAGALRSDGNGGYVARHEDYLFIGESNFAQIYDISDFADIQVLSRLDLEGDLDTMYPVGNLAILSVDDKANPDQGTAIAPWQTEPDTNPPIVDFVWPADGAIDVALTSRIGITLNEMVDVGSAWEGSVRLYPTGTDPGFTRVDGLISAQEAIVNFHPLEPLMPDTEYTLEVPAGGLHDWSGNAVDVDFSVTFTTGEF